MYLTINKKHLKRYFQGDKTKLLPIDCFMYNVNEGIIIISPNELVNYNISKKTFSLLFSPRI